MIRKVTVAILSWNGRQHLETCLDALAVQQDPGIPWEILVLDNGSTDGTAAWMRERWGSDRRLRLIESPVNLGFCGGNNRLVQEAEGDALALLNNDTRPEPAWLGSLVEPLASGPPDVAAVSGKIVDWKGERLDFGRGLMTFDGHAFQLDFRRPLKTARVPAAGEELPFACGGNLLVRRDSFLAAGGFDESYFAYLEDVDLGWRLWSGGERIVFAPGAVVHHRSSATSDLLGLYNRGFLFERNAFLTAYKNYEDGLWEKILPAVMLTLLSRTQALLLANPGMDTLRIDPYAGHIANTGPASRPVVELPPATTWEGFKVRWRGYGPRD
ncbi:MAG: glycosyltransferase family 2 protein, partial [Thermoanaerobaculia bacterium]